MLFELLPANNDLEQPCTTQMANTQYLLQATNFSTFFLCYVSEFSVGPNHCPAQVKRGFPGGIPFQAPAQSTFNNSIRPGLPASLMEILIPYISETNNK